LHRYPSVGKAGIRLVAKIQAEEQALIEHLQTVTRDLERRIAVRNHQW